MRTRRAVRWSFAAALALAVSGAVLAGRTGIAGTDEACLACHGDEVSSRLRRAYRHAPFVRRQCGACHLRAQDAETAPVAVAPVAPEGEKTTPCALPGGGVQGEELMITVCYKCHDGLRSTLSHPVGVRVREGTTLPAGLPVLEGGVITCITCHEVHTGDQPWRFRREVTNDICVECHQGY